MDARFALAAVLMAAVLYSAHAGRELGEEERGFFGAPWFGGGFHLPVFGGPGPARGDPAGSFAGFPLGALGTKPSMVCMDKGPCHNKKLTCPAKCFHSWGKSGKHGGGSSGGGGGCSFDCKKCKAFC